MTEQERWEYCKDCERSYFSEHPSCDVNIEDKGYYNLAGDKCYCKIVNGKMAEKYPWQVKDGEQNDSRA